MAGTPPPQQDSSVVARHAAGGGDATGATASIIVALSLKEVVALAWEGDVALNTPLHTTTREGLRLEVTRIATLAEREHSARLDQSLRAQSRDALVPVVLGGAYSR